MSFELRRQSLLRSARDAIAGERLLEARQFCERVLGERRNDYEALDLLTKVTWQEGDRDKAIEMQKDYVRRNPKDFGARLGLGTYYFEQGRYQEAIAQFDRAQKLAPNDLRSVAGIAKAYERKGDLARARKRLEPFVRNGSLTAEMAETLIRADVQEREFERAISLAREFLERSDTPHFYKSQIGYLLGQAYEKSGRYSSAFEAFQNANRLFQAAYDADLEVRRIDETIEAFSETALADLPRATTDSTAVVFVVGRPRSGTTLIERILAAHPAVHAAGEIATLTRISLSMSSDLMSMQPYPNCIHDLDVESANRLSEIYLDQVNRRRGGTTRITDKQLYNWRRLGLAELLLPQARVIDVRRDPMDNCLSCFMSPLGDRFPFCHDLTALGHSHRQYERLMSHWHEVLRLPIMTVRYEDVVADIETWARRMIEFCELPWDEQCLRFYDESTQKGSTAAPTLSYEQVRQPIYDQSVGRAKRFEEFLGPLRAALAG